MTTVFDYVNYINKKAGDNPRDDIEQFEDVYKQFVVHRQFSYFPDTVMASNEINIRCTTQHGLTNLQSFDYLNNTISKGSRYTKWTKPTKNDDIEIIRKVYGYSIKQAEDVLDIFTEDDIKNLYKRIDEGGK